MASTYSKLKIELIGTGDQAGQWGTTTNNNLGSSSAGVYRGLEQAIVGMATISSGFVANSYTLPYTNSNDDQEFRCLVLNITASLSNPSDLIVPAIQKPYIVINSSGQTVTVKVSGQTGVAVPNGAKILLYNTGTDVGTAITYLTELKLGGNLTMPSAGSINDSNGNELIKFPSAVASAVNELTISNAATGSAPTLSATGGDTNIGITLTPKGTGTLFTAGNVSFDGGTFVFNESGADKDFRIEGDTQPNLFFTDASTDRVGIGTSSPVSKLQVVDGDITVTTSGSFSGFNSTRATVPSGVGQQLGKLNFSAYSTGTTYVQGASIQAFSSAAWSSTSAPSYLSFQTTPSGSTSLTERMVLDSSGNLGLGGTAATGCTLDVQGTSALKMPVGTTAQRPSSPVNGMTRMNTNTGQPEWYDATTSSWVSFNGSPTTSYGVEYLIVGGGGGGNGGGGGAGGLIQGVVSVSPGVTYRATVGGGGAAGSSRGNDSSFTTLSAIGGGGGQGYSSTENGGTVNGGSGGGAANDVGLKPAGAGITGQGNNGGTASPSGGGGGGGASAAGSSGSSAGGAGGNGTASSISGSSVTYAGGGGGGGSSSGGAGGTGGGGPGGSVGGTAGTANRGGGGGGGYNAGGGAGGSGVVIIRYPGSQRGTGGTVTTSDGYTIHTFNSSAFYVG